MTPEEIHQTFMRRALEVARRGWGTTHPNPMVGALIVEGGQVVAEGHHRVDGGPHAEKEALAALGRPPRPGAALYVTLEPCSTAGRTGACTEAILAAGIKQVVVGATDPTPEHAGRGFELLRTAGVEVIAGVLEADCADLNFIFNHWTTRRAPLVAAKLAVTLDGRIATRSGESKWITGEVARANAHRWRRLFPAIAVGAGTVLKDNPRLTARVEGEEEWCPHRIVFDGLLRTVADRSLPAVYTDEYRDRTIVVTTRWGGLANARRLRELGVQVWSIDSNTQRVSFDEVRRKCIMAGITGIFFEGGANILSELIAQRWIDYFFVYRGTALLGDEKAKPALAGFRTERLAQSLRLREVRHEALGDDSLARGWMVYPDKVTIDETTFGPPWMRSRGPS